VIFVSDGAPTDTESYKAWADQLRGKASVFSVGVDVPSTALTHLLRVASSADQFYNVAGSDLGVTFDAIVNKLILAGTNAVLTDHIHSDFQIVGNPVVSQGKASKAGQTVTWNAGQVPTGTAATLKIQVKLTAAVLESQKTFFETNADPATLTYKNFDALNSTQYVDTPTLERTPPSFDVGEVSMTKSAEWVDQEAGKALITFDITGKEGMNGGAVVYAGINALLEDTIGYGFEIDGNLITNHGTFSESNGEISWDIGNIPQEPHATLTIPVKLTNNDTQVTLLKTNHGNATLT
jgi:hypothetical protein